MNKSRGRPRGNPPTKAHIAAAARDLFLARGYRGTTVRAVAAAAGVDSALIAYHFGSKQGLFGACMDVACGDALAVALTGDRDALADRLLRAVTELWDAAEPGDEVAALARISFPDEALMGVVREYLEHELLARIAEFLGGPDATERAVAAVTVLGGLIFTRYLNPLPTAARMSADDVCRVLAPSLRAALAPRSRFPASRPRSRPPRPHPHPAANG